MKQSKYVFTSCVPCGSPHSYANQFMTQLSDTDNIRDPVNSYLRTTGWSRRCWREHSHPCKTAPWKGSTCCSCKPIHRSRPSRRTCWIERGRSTRHNYTDARWGRRSDLHRVLMPVPSRDTFLGRISSRLPSSGRRLTSCSTCRRSVSTRLTDSRRTWRWWRRPAASDAETGSPWWPSEEAENRIRAQCTREWFF